MNRLRNTLRRIPICFFVGLTLCVTAITPLSAKAASGRVLGAGVRVLPDELRGVVFTNVSAGYAHSLAVKLDGTVVAWGENNSGQSTVPLGLTNVVKVAAGGFLGAGGGGIIGHSLALKANGMVVAWGDNRYGQTNVPPILGEVTAISAGADHSLALKRDGTVIAWGYTGPINLAPTLTNISAISAGGSHSLALRSNGTVVAWGGGNAFGQTNAPSGLSNVMAIAAGENYSTVLLSNGTVLAWGYNGLGSTNVPANLNGVVSIAAGQFHNLALKTNGTVVMWGYTSDGQANVPIGLSNVVAATAGDSQSLALKRDGTITAWGWWDYGQSVPPSMLTNAVSISANFQNSLALSDNGTVFAWGKNDAGQTNVPTDLTNVVSVAAGGQHSLALIGNGTVRGWGNSLFATPPAGLSDVRDIKAGDWHSLALRTNGTVIAWGNNTFGQTNVPASVTNVTAIAAGAYYSVALRSDGVLIGWGDNQYGQTNVPNWPLRPIAVAAGGFSGLALLEDGTVRSWGFAGTANVPPGLSNVVAIAAGTDTAFAIKNDRTVTAWGITNKYGISLVPTNRNVLSVAAGRYFSLTLLQRTPSLGWTNPTALVYGTALSSNQLNATANVPGSFLYSASAGTVLDAGSNTLSAVFNPIDAINYDSVTTSVGLIVLPAPLTVTASDANRLFAEANPNFGGTVSGLTNGDNISASYDCPATVLSPPSLYPITATLSDPAGRLVNYAVTIHNGTLTVAPRPLPDLVVARLLVTNTALAGQPVPFTWLVTNAGDATAVSPWQETLSLADNPAGTNATLLVTLQINNSLAVGGVSTRSSTVILPAGLSGNYWPVVRVDSANQVTEGYGETNNFFVAAQPILIQSPDLRVSLLTSAATGIFGQPLAVSWVVTNAGNGSAMGSWSDRVWLSSSSNSVSGATLLASVTANVSSLQSTASYSNGATVTVPLTSQSQTGAYWLVVQADGTGAVAESSEGNNLRSVPLALTLPPMPDLVVGQMSSDSSGFAGQSATVTWAVSNVGPASVSGSWNETLYLLTDAGHLQGRLTPSAVVGIFTFTNTLSAGDFLLRTQSIAIPLTTDTGTLRFVVQVDSANELLESVETNNLALATNSINIPATLTLQLPVSQLLEGSPSVSATIVRNGSTALPLLVTLTNSDPAQLAMTNSVLIPAGQSSAHFNLTALADGIVGDTQVAVIIASAPGFLSAQQALTIIDADVPHLALTLATNSVTEGFTVGATVTRDYVTSNSLTVYLQSSDPNRLVAPLTVTIPASSNSWTFALLATDDNILQTPTTVSISASAVGFTSGSAAVTVLDNDFPAMTLTLAQTNISEGAGPLATIATLTRSPVTARPVFVALESSNTNVARVPAAVTIPQGQVSVTFPVAAVDNTIVDGSRPTLLTAYVLLSPAGPQLGVGASAWLTVNDDDGPSFKLTVARKLVAEGLSPATTATVAINFTTNQSVVVHLTSSDTDEAVVPATVTIPANQTSTTLNIVSVNDGVTDGNKTVTITASASGVSTSSDILTVTDVNLPDLIVSSITAPATADTLSYVNISYRILNQGLTTAGSNWTTRVSLARDPLTGNGIPLGNFTFNGNVPAGQFYDQAVSLPVPLAAGDYWVVVQTDLDNQVVESKEDNNTSVSSAPIHVQPAYEAWVQADLHSALAGTPVPMHGKAYKGNTNTPAPGSSPVNIHIFVRGTHRVIPAQADASGNFTTVWNPLPGEAGVYQIGAAHPGDATAPVQDTFRLLGMSATPSSASVKVVDQGILTGQIQLANLSDQLLTGLSASSVGGPANLQVTASLSASVLPGLDQITLNYIIAANNTSVLQGTATLHVTSAEGVTIDVPLNVIVEPRRARLVANPSPLYSGMKRGLQTTYAFDLMNQGGTNTGPITVSLPNAAWLSLAVTNPLPSIARGETNRVTLLLSPATNLSLGDFNGSLALNCDTASLNVPFTFRSLSDAKGELRITAVDDYTYYAVGSPKVTNATVIITDAVSRQVLTNGVTDSQGVFLAAGLPESYYQIRVTADRHSVYQGTQLLIPGQTTDVTAFMARQTVSYIWTVTPVPFEDRVTISVETVFETYVPVPVVTVEPAFIDLASLTTPGQQMQVDLKISNHGLIAANHGRLTPSINPNYQVIPLISDLGTLPALSSLTVPLTISYSPAGARAAGKSQRRSAVTDSDSCDLNLQCSSDWQCGLTLNQNVSSVNFGIPACTPTPLNNAPPTTDENAVAQINFNPIQISSSPNCEQCPQSQTAQPKIFCIGRSQPDPTPILLTAPGAGPVDWDVSPLLVWEAVSENSIRVSPRDAEVSGQAKVEARYYIGSQPCSQTFPIIIYKITTETVSLHPDPRHRLDLGVGEEVKCKVEPDTIGSFTWKVENQVTESLPSIITTTEKPETLFQAGDRQSQSTLTLKIALGQQTKTATIYFNVMEPTSVGPYEWVEQAGVTHANGSIGGAVVLRARIHPNHVSWKNLTYNEGDGANFYVGTFWDNFPLTLDPSHCNGGTGCGAPQPTKTDSGSLCQCCSVYDAFGIGPVYFPDLIGKSGYTYSTFSLCYRIRRDPSTGLGKPFALLFNGWRIFEDGSAYGYKGALSSFDPEQWPQTTPIFSLDMPYSTYNAGVRNFNCD
jgi:alpha-tubulin suppressor-like RCC1 family protein